MGESRCFRCLKCGYEAIVSGGPDIGFVVETRTMFCRTCRQLRDVAVGFWCRDLTRVWDRENLNDEDLGRCPECRGGDLSVWSKRDPCPLCGGTVADEGNVSDWD